MRSKRTQVKRGKPKKRIEPIAEGITGRKGRRYTSDEVELIKRRYAELVEKELNDNQIAKKISKDLERSKNSILYKIRKMRENEEIGENSNNKKEYTEKEVKLIKRRYDELVREGLNDKEISKKIAKELGRSAGSVEQKIKSIREGREIGKNPNKGLGYFTADDIELIKRRYDELVREGLNDSRISKRIGEEIERSASSVEKKIENFRKDKAIRENPNNRKKYTKEEIQLIKRRYSELVQEGRNDNQIGKKIGNELDRSISSVKIKILKLKENKEIEENPNKGAKPFSEEEIQLIKKRRAEFIERGLKDEQISEKIGKELGRSASSVGYKIRELRKNKEIEENPNMQKIFSEEEIELIKRRYAELVVEGLDDFNIAKRIAKKLGRSTGSVDQKIRQLKRNEELADAEALREKQDILGVVRALEEFE